MQVTSNIAWQARPLPEVKRIEMTFMPHEALDFDIGLYHVRKIIDAWVVLIETNDWDHKDCGFTDDDYSDALMFAVDDLDPARY